MYTKRNTITLALLLLVILAIGTSWTMREMKKLGELRERNLELSEQFHGSELVVQTLESVEANFAELQERWQNAAKKILALDEPAFTISYINWLIQNYKLDLSFDFYLNSLDKKEPTSTFTFSLNGEASYRDLYTFVWHLTHNPLLYKIEGFSLAKAQQDGGPILFKLQIRGFYMQQKWEMDHDIRFASFENEVKITDYHDVFRALAVQTARPSGGDLISRPKNLETQPAPQPQFPDIEKANLLALTSNTIYIREKNNKVTTLQVGDRVNRGSLEKIDSQKSEAHFVLQTTGGRRTVILGLGYIK
ncbi:MAG TPA: hypothetical protein PKW76_04650 [bacterium]|jgi:Tfp pilus assembly protein PilO|nr:hypothetical protein [bacterium]HPG44949.1 hypothetical protein [bacterium]HPM99638.1 hypothetical protein [bacterium]